MGHGAMPEESNWLVHDHRRHEAALTECELAAGAEDWREAVELFRRFVDGLRLHMRMEDEVLYPLFEETCPGVAEDIADLRYEHERLSQLVEELVHVIRHKDFDHLEASLRPLKRIMMEHNAHEELVFRRMSDSPLLQRREEIMERLARLGPVDEDRGFDF